MFKKNAIQLTILHLGVPNR